MITFAITPPPCWIRDEISVAWLVLRWSLNLKDRIRVLVMGLG